MINRALPTSDVDGLRIASERCARSQKNPVAASMTLSTTGSADEVRQMIEGRLADMGKDPRHVQVLIPEAEGAHLQLQDVDSVFLDVAPEEDEHEHGRESSPERSEWNEEEEVVQLQLALQEAQSLSKTVQDEVSVLTSQLEKKRKKVKEMWYKNCDQLMRYLPLRMKR